MLNNRNKKSLKKSYFYISVFLIVICGIRDPFIYRDMPNYHYYFYHGEMLIGDSLENINLGYEYLNNWFKYLTRSFNLFSFTLAVFINGAYLHLIKKDSQNPAFSLFLFVLVFYFSTFFLLRQYLSCTCAYISYRYILKQNVKLHLLWVGLAISFHTMAVCILPLYVLYIIPKTKLNVTILLGIAVFATVSMRIIAGYFASYSEWYSAYLNSEYEASLLRIGMKILICLVYVWVLKEKCLDKGWNSLILIFLVMEIVLYIGSSCIDGVYRMRAYFDLGEILGIPIMLQHIQIYRKPKLAKRLIYLYIVLLVASCYSFLTGGCFDGGYKTFF